MSDPREVLSRPAPPPDLTLAYGPEPEHIVDVRLPVERPAPLVVVIHGGFWRSEFDRTHTGPMTTALAAEGYVVATPEYRRTGAPAGSAGSGSGFGFGGGWPGTFEDIAAALTALPDLLASYVKGPVTWVGHSAGGHLALWAACRLPTPAHQVVSLAGCVNLSLCSKLDLDDGATDLLMGGPPDAVPERYEIGDPALLPPPNAVVTLIHGTEDDRVPIGVSRSYAARTPGCRLLELPGVEHFALIDPLSPAWTTVLAAVTSGISPSDR